MRTADGDDLHVGRPSTRYNQDDVAQRGEPTGFSKLTAPIMARAMRHANRKDLRQLKQILESHPRAEPRAGED